MLTVLAALFWTRLLEPVKNAKTVSSLRQIRQRALPAQQVALPALMLHHATPALPLRITALEPMPPNLSCVLRQIVLTTSMLTRRFHPAKLVVLSMPNALDVLELQFALNALTAGNLGQERLHVSPAPPVNSSTRQIANVSTSFLAALAGITTGKTSVLHALQPTAPNAATLQELVLNVNLCIH